MSAHQMLNGTFDYNRTPLAPPGTKILIHEKPNQRQSWDPHGVEGWYLRPATDHYRCYRVYVNKTSAERITDTVEFFPQEIEMPFPTPTEIAIEAAKALIHTLKDPIPSTPFAHQPYNRKQAIQNITDIFKPYGSPELPTHVIEPDTTGPPKNSTRTNREPPHLPPRVATPEPRHRSPRVSPTLIEEEPRYPKRHLIPREHTANLVTTMLTNNQEENVDRVFLPKITTNTEHWACSIIDPDTGATMEYRHLIKSPKDKDDWAHSFANEIGRVAKGIGNREKGTNTIFCIPHSQIPQDRRRDVTYGRICVDHRPQKKEAKRTRL
jgi:hypothetical protein